MMKHTHTEETHVSSLPPLPKAPQSPLALRKRRRLMMLLSAAAFVAIGAGTFARYWSIAPSAPGEDASANEIQALKNELDAFAAEELNDTPEEDLTDIDTLYLSE